jgi:hypothetical protein
MEKIWRVENMDGLGPYKVEDDNGRVRFCQSPLIHHNSLNGHPAPYNDPGIERGPWPEEICGFATVAQAHAWFSEEELEWLEVEGFYLKQIEVYRVTAKGKFQVLAVRENCDSLMLQS